MDFRPAGPSDIALLIELNQQLIEDEGHRNRMTRPELRERWLRWLADDYEAYLFEQQAIPVGYALFRRGEEHIYIRHFFISRSMRRQGYGRRAFLWLTNNVWAHQRLRIDVLIGNEGGIRFWQSLGFTDYCIVMEADPTHDRDLSP